MSTPELHVAFENELRRVLIQNHLNYAVWYRNLSTHSRQVIDAILDEDVTDELINFSQEAPNEEWDAHIFLRAISGGNPDPDVSLLLTHFSLGEILREVREFRKVDE